MKRIISIFTALIMCGTFWIPSFSADKAEGITIRLAKTDGSGVSVATGADKSLAVKENMRLLSGYKIGTDKSSFAFLSLDDTKAVKLDHNTKAEIKKEGSKNQVTLSTGKIFFDVKEKLKSGENMQIETSNVSMGIRGTSGVVMVEYIPDEQGKPLESYTTVQIFDGAVSLNISNPKTGEKVSHLLSAGEAVGVYQQLYDSREAGIVFKPLEASDIPSFAASEILESSDLINRMESETELTEEQLREQKAETEAAEKKAEAIREQLLEEAQKQAESDTSVVPAGEEAAAASGGGGGSSGGSGSDGTVINDSSQLQADIASGSGSIPAGTTVNLSAPLSIGAGQSLTVEQGGTLNTGAHDVSLEGTLNNKSSNTINLGSGNIILAGAGEFYNEGRITSADGKIIVAGGDNRITNSAGCSIPKLEIQAGSTVVISMDGGSIELLENYGTVKLDESAKGSKVQFGTNIGTVRGIWDIEGCHEASAEPNNIYISNGEKWLTSVELPAVTSIQSIKDTFALPDGAKHIVYRGSGSSVTEDTELVPADKGLTLLAASQGGTIIFETVSSSELMYENRGMIFVGRDEEAATLEMGSNIMLASYGELTIRKGSSTKGLVKSVKTTNYGSMETLQMLFYSSSVNSELENKQNSSIINLKVDSYSNNTIRNEGHIENIHIPAEGSLRLADNSGSIGNITGEESSATADRSTLSIEGSQGTIRDIQFYNSQGALMGLEEVTAGDYEWSEKLNGWQIVSTNP